MDLPLWIETTGRSKRTIERVTPTRQIQVYGEGGGIGGVSLTPSCPSDVGYFAVFRMKDAVHHFPLI